jgi:hypothetical protein
MRTRTIVWSTVQGIAKKNAANVAAFLALLSATKLIIRVPNAARNVNGSVC